ncbi:SMI1/KNR4 family protein [Aestuariibacter sp. AA17]|uniref:SMI1/KNR4 family protein n=1 Tax=Fluctibacter corallii TaxID=2984329 RepID=A0ABT3A7X6_9ALTE|nr:SMI1/KNR4 family protein [Aestuariibacter sp. AA17]MCV2884720.1 SMI1/KNR4 family protein [Aestuariibacter sp. AA17]
MSVFLSSIVGDFYSNEAINNISLEGYSEEEILKIEKLYNIDAKGQLRLFLSEVGRTFGGVIGDHNIQLYRPTWKVRQHLLFQADFFDQMQEAGHFSYLKKPFVFSFQYETQYYFVQTAIDECDSVFRFDSNTNTISEAGFDLVDFLKDIVSRDEPDGHTLARGDLLAII